MRIADFFQELWPLSFGTPRGSVRDFLAPNPYEDAGRITEYLLGGHEVFSVMGSSEDVLGSGRTVLGGDSVLSDGEWIWRGDLWFYVRTHDVELPGEFLARIRQHDYLVPAGNEPRMIAVAEYVAANLRTGRSGRRTLDSPMPDTTRIDIDDPEVDMDRGQRLLYRGEPFTGEVEEHLGGAPVSLDSYVEGVRHGPGREWYKDGTLRSEATAREGLPVGTSREWHPNGVLAAEVEFSGNGAAMVAERRWDEEGRPTKNWHAGRGSTPPTAEWHRPGEDRE